MQDKLIALLDKFVSGRGMVGYMLTWMIAWAVHQYWRPGIDWIKGNGTDEIVMRALAEFKYLLAKAGASSDEISGIERVVAQIALRAAQDIDIDAGKQA